MLNLCISHINQGFISLQTLRTHRQDGNKVKKERKLEYVVAFPYPSGRFFNTPTVPMQAKHTQFYMLCNVCLTVNFNSPPKRGIVTNHTATTAEKKKVKHDCTHGNESYLIICILLRHCFSQLIVTSPLTYVQMGELICQWQLIAMACALVWQSSIIVLDQATSSVDFPTDAMIHAAIRKEFNDCLLLTGKPLLP